MNKEDGSCRICGSNSYSEVTKSNGIRGPGGRVWVIHYVCDGCSVIFKS